jgi:hypothetical protein
MASLFNQIKGNLTPLTGRVKVTKEWGGRGARAVPFAVTDGRSHFPPGLVVLNTLL